MANVRCHIAIVAGPYDRLILDGRKTIEARLTRTPLPPFGMVGPGDRICFKRSGGPFFASAVAARVLMVDRLTPRTIAQLRKRYDQWICGEPAYWRSKHDAAYATLIWLRDVRPGSDHPPYKPQNMRAWYTLDIPAEPRRTGPIEIELTAGAIRQHYVRLGLTADRFAATDGGSIELRLTGGPTIRTEIVRGMFRWRGWGAWFQAHQLRPGDRLQFTRIQRRCYEVRPDRRP